MGSLTASQNKLFAHYEDTMNKDVLTPHELEAYTNPLGTDELTLKYGSLYEYRRPFGDKKYSKAIYAIGVDAILRWVFDLSVAGRNTQSESSRVFFEGSSLTKSGGINFTIGISGAIDKIKGKEQSVAKAYVDYYNRYGIKSEYNRKVFQDHKDGTGTLYVTLRLFNVEKKAIHDLTTGRVENAVYFSLYDFVPAGVKDFSSAKQKNIIKRICKANGWEQSEHSFEFFDDNYGMLSLKVDGKLWNK